jgi:hypothetical protein
MKWRRFKSDREETIERFFCPTDDQRQKDCVCRGRSNSPCRPSKPIRTNRFCSIFDTFSQLKLFIRRFRCTAFVLRATSDRWPLSAKQVDQSHEEEATEALFVKQNNIFTQKEVNAYDLQLSRCECRPRAIELGENKFIF